MTTTKGTTVTRADAGIPRLTERDGQALAWLEDMRAVYETDLAVLLGRLDGRDGAVSPTAVRNAIRRWQRLGVASARKVFAHEPRFVWLTAEGASLVASGVRWREPGAGVLRHTALVARVRLWLEQRGVAGQEVVSWTSERAWRRANQAAVRAGAHIPDGVAALDDGTVYAVEVELSDKGPSRTLDIAVDLTSTYAHVIYVVPGQSQTARTVYGAVEQAASARGRQAEDGSVHVLMLPEGGQS